MGSCLAEQRRVRCCDVDSYLLCATPRSGSTLLCGLLRSSLIAGRPESYFRHEDLDDYADRWGIPRAMNGEIDATFVRAAVAAGSTPNGLFGARLMWGTMTELTDALLSAAGGGSTVSDLELLTGAFGRTRFVHLRRNDTVAQAVSWARAEQTHFWQPGEEMAPGSQEPHFDPDLIGRLVERIIAHEAAWQVWFAHRGLVPHDIAYEDLAADPVGVTLGVLEFLGLELPPASTISVADRRQADDLNVDWIARFRA